MTRLNVRLLAILAITLLVLTTGVVVVHALQMRSNVDSLIKRADVAKTDDPRTALRLYALYRSYKPDDAEVFADYAIAAADVLDRPGANRRDFDTAVGALEQVLSNAPPAREAELRKRLIKLDIMAGRYVAAKDHLLKLKAKNQADAESDLQLAQCMISTGDYMGAVQLLESLIGYDPKTKTFDVAKAKTPKEFKAYSTLAAILRDKISDSRMLDRLDLADRVIDQMVTVNSDSAKAFLAQAQFLKDKQDRERAKPAIEKALALAPDDADVLIQAIELTFQSQDFAGAEKHIEKGIELYPKDDRFYFMSVLAADAQKNSEEASKRLERGLAKLPSSARLLDLDFNRKIQKNDLDAAAVTLNRMANTKMDGDLRNLAEAKLWFAQRKYTEASQRLETLRPRFSHRPELAGQIDLMLSEIYNAQGQYDLVSKFAGRESSLQSQLMQATALMGTGKTHEALVIYEGIAGYLEKQNALMSMPQIASTLLQLRIADQAAKPKEQRDWSRIDDLLTKIRDAKVVKEPNISLVEADILNRKGETERARQLLQSLRSQFPSDIAVVAVSAGFELQDKKLDAAKQIIDSAPPEVRNSPALYGARLEALFASGGQAENVKADVTQLADEIEKLSKEERLRLYPVLGTAYMRLGDPDLAMQEWKKAGELAPKDARIRWMMFDMARQTGDIATLKEMQTWFAGNSNSGKEGSESKLAEATVLTVGVRESSRKRLGDQAVQISLTDAEKADLSAARSLLRDIASDRPDWIEEPRLLAEIDVLEGRLDEAVAELRKVMDRGQPTSQVVSQLVRLLHFRQRDEEALEVLNKYRSLVTGDELRKLATIIEISQGDLKSATEYPFDKNSKVWSEHLFHGQVMAAANRGEEAEADFRRAKELGPDEPQAWLAYIGQLVNNKKPEEALKAVQEAQIELPEDRRSLVLAQGYELVNDQTQSEHYYQTALEAAPKDTAVQRVVASYYLRQNKKEDAKKLLSEIMAADPVGPAKENIGWARRVTAQMLAGEGTYRQFRKALETLSPPGEKPSAEDLAVQISLLVDRSDPTSTREALRLLEQLKQIRLLNWRERLGLATLYERIGKWNLAREEMLSLISSKPDPSVYIAYVEMLLRRGDVDEASSLLQSVLKNADQNNSLPLAMLSAKTLSLQGRGPEAAKLLTGLLPTQRPLPQQQWPLLGSIATSLEQIGQVDEAEKLWREYVSYDSRQVLQLAGLLAREGKVDAALDLGEQYRREFPAPQLLSVGMAALRQTVKPPTPEQVARVQKWFDRAIQEDPDSLLLQIQLADLRDFQGKFDEAEKLYRAILARSDTPPTDRAVILNNLSFLLAMQGRNMDEALKLINDAIDLFGPQSDMLDTRGVVSLSKGDVKQALADLNDAVIVTNPSGIKYVHLAMAQAKAKDLTGARQSIDKAKQLKFKRDDLSPLEKPIFDALLKQLNMSV